MVADGARALSIPSASSGAALDKAAFARLMAPFQPFAPRPRLAVAVSGGGDSMALALLARRWIEDRDGELTALIVDHGLRRESAREAAGVAERLAALAIQGVVLPWSGGKPVTGVQEAAREARYRLLGGWCRDNSVTDLLVAHHAGDLAETVWMRLARGGEGDGLAAMRPLTYARWGRLLRPLLSVAPEALRATLREVGVAWVEDPSNSDPRFERARWRAMAARLEASGLDRERMGGLARLAARVGDVLDEATVRLLASACRLDPLGFAELGIAQLAASPMPVAARALQRMIAIVGGRPRPPSLRRVRPFLASIASANGRGRMTLGRVLLSNEGRALLLCRERRHLPTPCVIAPGRTHHWDGRFTVSVEGPFDQRERSLWLRPLAASDWPVINAAKGAGTAPRPSWPMAVWSTLPVLADDTGPLASPLLDFRRSDAPLLRIAMAFRPRWPAPCGAYFLA